jgi:hypothetical protein
MDIGGNVPTFLTAPVMIDTVKTLIGATNRYFAEAREGYCAGCSLTRKKRQSKTALQTVIVSS